MIGAFASDANVLLRAVSGQTIVVPGPFVANLVTRNRWFRWGSNRNLAALRGAISDSKDEGVKNWTLR